MNEKISKIVLYILFGLSILVAVIFYFGSKEPKSPGSDILIPTFIGQSLNWSYLLLLIAAVLALIFPIISIFSNPKKLKGTLIGLLVIVVFVGIAYLLASDVPVPSKEEAAASTLRIVDTGFIMLYVLLAVAVLGLLVSTIANIFK